MLVMNPEGTLLMNLNHTTALYVAKPFGCEGWEIQYAINNDELNATLAEYKTEERAKEILKQIADRQGATSTYYMPEE